MTDFSKQSLLYTQTACHDSVFCLGFYGVIKDCKEACALKFPSLSFVTQREMRFRRERTGLTIIHTTLKSLWSCPTYCDSQGAPGGWHANSHHLAHAVAFQFLRSPPATNKYLGEQSYRHSVYKWHLWIHQGHGWMILKVNDSVSPGTTDEYHFPPNVLWLLFVFFYWLFSVMDSSLLHL